MRESKLQSILRLNDVERVTGLPRSTMYEMIAKGLFPKPIELGERARGWLETEIEDWVKNRVAERDGS
jgi:prophage regulatory protein